MTRFIAVLAFVSLQAGAQTNVIAVTVPPHGRYMHENDQITCHTQAADSLCYNDIDLSIGTGPGLLNVDYRRAEHYGTGPSITRKTAVRGADSQWAVWAHQINMGPGAKAALWISGDNPEIEGRGFDTVPNVIVVNSNLHVVNAVIQRNAPAGENAAVLRVFNGSKLVAEIMEDGTFRVKRIEYIP